MAGATALDIAGHHLVSSSGVCPVLSSRTYFFRGFGRNSASFSFTKNSVTFGPTRRCKVQALLLEPSDGAQENLEGFVKRMEQTWSITKQPRPVQCKSCRASGQVDCPWCNGTGFFTIGDNVLCEVPSRNTTCRVCFGREPKVEEVRTAPWPSIVSYNNLCTDVQLDELIRFGGFDGGYSRLKFWESDDTCSLMCTLPCDDCKGTGFRAKWLGDPEKPNSKGG